MLVLVFERVSFCWETQPPFYGFCCAGTSVDILVSHTITGGFCRIEHQSIRSFYCRAFECFREFSPVFTSICSLDHSNIHSINQYMCSHIYSLMQFRSFDGDSTFARWNWCCDVHHFILSFIFQLLSCLSSANLPRTPLPRITHILSWNVQKVAQLKFHWNILQSHNGILCREYAPLSTIYSSISISLVVKHSLTWSDIWSLAKKYNGGLSGRGSHFSIIYC